MFNRFERERFLDGKMKLFFESVRDEEVRRVRGSIMDMQAQYLLDTYDLILQHNMQILKALVRWVDFIKVNEADLKILSKGFIPEYNLIHLPFDAQHQNLNFQTITHYYAGLNPQIRNNPGIILYNDYLYLYQNHELLQMPKPDNLSHKVWLEDYQELSTKIAQQPYHNLSNDCRGSHDNINSVISSIDSLTLMSYHIPPPYTASPEPNDFATIKTISLQLMAVLNRNQNELNEKMWRAIKWTLLGFCLYASILGLGFWIWGTALLPMLAVGAVGVANGLGIMIVILLSLRAVGFYAALSKVKHMLSEVNDLPNAANLTPQRLNLNGFFSTHEQQLRSLFGYPATGQVPAGNVNIDTDEEEEDTDNDSIISM